MINSELLLAILTAVLAGLLSAAAIKALSPLLKRYALAKPNARSSHRVPTPQGAGIAVLAATLAAAGVAITWASTADVRIPLALFGSSLFIAAVGFADDIRPIPVLPRLVLQAIAVGVLVFSAPADLRIVPAWSVWIERAVVLLAGVWFVNLVNLMDGLDWMTVAEAVPVTGAMVILGLSGCVAPQVTLIAAALCGAMLGFAPSNRPVAKVFLGDVGSLPIGLLLGWCLLQLAWREHLLAALVLPFYYVGDTSVTLIRRISMRERFWMAHRSHFYQRAIDNGSTVSRVVGEVFALNLLLATLAIVSVQADSALVQSLIAIVAAAGVMLLLYRFSRPRSVK